MRGINETGKNGMVTGIMTQSTRIYFGLFNFLQRIAVWNIKYYVILGVLDNPTRF